jgi:hypothetical protein
VGAKAWVTRCDQDGVWYGRWSRNLPPSRSRAWGAGAVELRQSAKDYESHSPNHAVEGDDCCGGGSVNKGPICCTEKPYWVPQRRRATSTNTWLYPWTGQRTSRRAILKRHIGVPRRRRAASTSTELRPWTGRRTAKQERQ